MRCGFDRLAERVRAVIGEDPMLCGGPRYVAGMCVKKMHTR